MSCLLLIDRMSGTQKISTFSSISQQHTIFMFEEKDIWKKISLVFLLKNYHFYYSGSKEEEEKKNKTREL